ncbi:MAG: acetyl-CoA decarbonylase/synthase complex subunit gamma [Chitinispirillaceae bacterium]|nr:acetyl-CoA decarbonylase/synthase complex subunit gamma [Chitinispirillaceae bacterium]
MAKKLTGMDIFKLLPKTNCGECGVPTCMAFAMKLAQKNASLSACPYASEEAKAVIGAASEPPIRLVKFGSGDRTALMGNELVMFRHEKTFVHQTVLAVQLDASMDTSELGAIAASLDKHVIERAGERLPLDALCINDTGRDAEDWCSAVRAAASNFNGPLILKSASCASLIKAADMIADRVPLLHAITKDNYDELGEYARARKLPAVIKGSDLDELHSLAGALASAGYRDMVLDTTGPAAAATLQNNTMARKAALQHAVKPLGYPVMNFITGRGAPELLVADASTGVCKYASLLVIDQCAPEILLPLLMLRQNIYTDPQKPIQVEPKLYPVGEPIPASPVLVTTNFSLTYFIVSGEVESSGVPAHLAVVDAEGLSVLTAWAAGKFSADKIAGFVKSQTDDLSMSNRKLVIPGYVSCLSGEVEERLPGWEIIVGPQEASDIGPFMKRFV